MRGSKALIALKMLEQYILQQRKLNSIIWTNDPTMKELIEKAHPNMDVKLINLNQFISPPISNIIEDNNAKT